MKRDKPDFTWTAVLDGCMAFGVDFVSAKKSNPPDIDADPIILEFPIDKQA